MSAARLIQMGASAHFVDNLWIRVRALFSKSDSAHHHIGGSFDDERAIPITQFHVRSSADRIAILGTGRQAQEIAIEC